MKGNYSALAPAISEDSTKVVFRSAATNLDPADTDPEWDIYLKDLVSGQLSLVSTNSDGVKANRYVSEPSLSGDGSKMVFRSGATNLPQTRPLTTSMCS